MPHYNSYESFKTKKSIAKKERAKEKSLGKKEVLTKEFIIKDKDNYAIVIEVKYDKVYVLYQDELKEVSLRSDLNKPANQILFPGDKVVLDDNLNTITNLIKRKSILSRIKKDSTKKDDLGITKNIAANIDIAIIVASAKTPPLHTKFIDRYLIILQNSNIPFIICLNKSDLKTINEEKILSIYKELNIPVVETSTYNNTGIEELKKYIKDKQSILVGNSGVGKSSLINALMSDNKIKTNDISEKSKRGRHTTTSSKYYIWSDNSSIIDTPGIRSLDVSTFSSQEIQEYFPEFSNWKDKCKYNNCLHYNEPLMNCLVKQGVKSNLISKNRYESYLRIIDDILEKNNSKKIIKELDQ